MTRPLRRAHLKVWAVMSVAMAALLFAALTRRPDPTPVNPELRWSQFR